MPIFGQKYRSIIYLWTFVLCIMIATIVVHGHKAEAAKTFRCAAGDFRKNVGDDDGGQCVIYVRYETGIPYTDFSGEAWTCFQQAREAGYATGSEPKVSSIAVFDKQGSMNFGHVGIVKSIQGNTIQIRDSNWNLNETVREHSIDTSRYSILGYIYCDGNSNSSYKLPDTGQHTCYDDDGNVIECPAPGEPFYGQDAQYQGPEPTYRDNGDGTVTDLNTGLMWMQATADTNGDEIIDYRDNLDWQSARDYCRELEFAECSEWRLPDRKELMSIVDYGRSYPAINPVFRCSYYDYWSSSNRSGTEGSWFVYFTYGYVYSGYNDNEYFVRCVSN